MNRLFLLTVFTVAAALAQPPAKLKGAGKAGVNDDRPHVAVFAGMAKDASPRTQKQTAYFTDSLRSKLSRDKTIVVVQQEAMKKIADKFAAKGLCGSMEELRAAVTNLPSECSIIMVVAMKGSEGSIMPGYTIARRKDFQGMQVYTGVPCKKPQLDDMDVSLVREIVDAVAGRKTKSPMAKTGLIEIKDFP
jgi:hypothetical protein